MTRHVQDRASAAAARIAILVLHGTDEWDLFSCVSLLAKANAVAGRPILNLRYVGETPFAASKNGICQFGELMTDFDGDFDAAVLPGSLAAEAGDFSPAARTWILRLAESGRPIFCICSGVFVLAHCELIQGRVVSVHQSKAARIEAFGARISAERLARDGLLTTIGRAGDVPKGTAIAMEILNMYCPELIDDILARVELHLPSREAH